MILRGLVFCGVFLLFRILSLQSEELVNATPIMGLLVCASVFYGMRGVITGALFWLVSFPLLSMVQGYFSFSGFLSSLLGMVIAYFFFVRTAKNGSTSIILNTLGASIVFYLVTNLLCWVSMPIYSKSLFGLYEALWLGKPEFPSPTWVFFRNSILGNLIFSVLVLLANAKWPAHKVNQAIGSLY